MIVAGTLGFINPFDDLNFVLMILEHVKCVRNGQHIALKRLILPDDLIHSGFERIEILRCERSTDVEVVVEPVGDRRSDRKRCTIVEVENRLS